MRKTRIHRDTVEAPARKSLGWAFLFLLLLPTPATPQADGDPVQMGTYRILHSQILGEDRTLQVLLPRGYEEGELGYPVVYLFYSDNLLGYYAQTVNDLYDLTTNLMPPVILVGIENVQRYRDLLPTPNFSGEGGQADRFLRFIREELFPFVEAEYRTEPYRIMVGPQAAAVFGTYAFIEEPETFDAFILNDPCRPDAEGETLCEELVALSATPAAAGKYFAVSHDAGDRRWDMERLEALGEGFGAQAHEGFRWQIRTDPDWPFFLAPVDIRTPLLDLFADYPFASMEDAESLSEILDHYQGLSEEIGFKVIPPNLVLTMVGARLTNQGSYQASLEVLTHLVELYPAAMDGPWQLANLHREMGDTATAIRYYQECVSRDPNMSFARTWLQRLGGGGG